MFSNKNVIVTKSRMLIRLLSCYVTIYNKYIDIYVTCIFYRTLGIKANLGTEWFLSLSASLALLFVDFDDNFSAICRADLATRTTVTSVPRTCAMHGTFTSILEAGTNCYDDHRVHVQDGDER